jgi:hypothetical protein
VPDQRLSAVFENIIQCLPESNSYAYISLKDGYNSKTDAEGRKFYLCSDKDLRKVFKVYRFKIIEFSKSVSLANSKDVWLGYVQKKY